MLSRCRQRNCAARRRRRRRAHPKTITKKKTPKKTKLDADRLSLHVGETTLTLPFTPQQGAELEDALNALLKTFADKAKAERPRRWEMMEVAWKGGGGAEPELLELVCNPNAYRFVCFVLRLCRQATPRIRAAAAVTNNPTTPHARPPPRLSHAQQQQQPTPPPPSQLAV